MFYQESQIIQNLICIKCREKLNEPVILPCGESICKSCVSFSSVTNQFDCLFCSKAHLVPENDGFPPNKSLQRLLRQNACKIYRGKSAEMLTDSLKQLDELITNTATYDYGLDSARDHINMIRNDVQLSIESAIALVHKYHDELLETLAKYEEECETAFELGKNSFYSSLDRLKKESTHLISSCKTCLEAASLDESDLERAISVVSHLKEKFSSLKFEFTKLIFNGKSIELSDNLASLDLSLIGKLDFVKMSPIFSDLNRINLREKLFSSNESLSTIHMSVNCLKNGSFVVSFSDTLIFRTLALTNLNGDCLKKLDLFTKKYSFDFITSNNLIIHSDFDFKSNRFSLNLRDETLGFLAKAELYDDRVMSVSACDSHIYCLKTNQKLCIYDQRLNIKQVITFQFWMPTNDITFRVFDSNKLLFKYSDQVCILNQSDQSLLTSFSLPIQNTANELNDFLIDSNNRILVYSMEKKLIRYFSLNGELLNERKLHGFPDSLSILLDNRNKLYFYDEDCLYF